MHLAIAQAVAALASEQKRAGWARESGAWGRNRSGGVRRLLQHEGRGQGRRNRGELEERKAAERRRGGESERQGERSFLTRGREGDGHLMPLCRGTCSATEFTLLPPNS